MTMLPRRLVATAVENRTRNSCCKQIEHGSDRRMTLNLKVIQRRRQWRQCNRQITEGPISPVTDL